MVCNAIGFETAPTCTFLADEIVRVRDDRAAVLVLSQVAEEGPPEHEGVGAEPNQLPLHLPAKRVGASKKRLHAGVLGNFGE
jgi:hypothetical protein